MTGRTVPGETHLDRLEAEAIYIIREAVAEAERPVMLFSGGKDSVAMLHLARKAFFPARPPVPLLHVDTGWKFAELYELRDRLAAEAGMELIVHRNPEAEARARISRSPRSTSPPSGRRSSGTAPCSSSMTTASPSRPWSDGASGSARSAAGR